MGMASDIGVGQQPAHRIVIADDDVAFRELLATLVRLERDLELVGVAKDGFEAVELVRKELPDLLLLDLAMPGLDGLDVMERLAAAGIDVKVVIVSGYGDPLFESAARGLGAIDYLVKGMLPEDAVARIKSACRT
jgi:two-component system response regulator (stage 0 sporulation protein A)